MQCSSFRQKMGQRKQTDCMLAPATTTISGFTTREMSQLLTSLCEWVTESPNCVSGGDTPLKFPRTLYLGQRAAEKPSTFIAILLSCHGSNYEHLECLIMLGTHSKLHRGQTSHIGRWGGY